MQEIEVARFKNLSLVQIMRINRFAHTKRTEPAFMRLKNAHSKKMRTCHSGMKTF